MAQKIQSDSKVSVLQSSLAGGGAGSLTRAVCQPLDVLKIRFQLQLEPITRSSYSKYRSMSQAIISIIREERITTLWSGHVPAQLLSITYGVMQFSTYERLIQLAETADPQFYINHKPGIVFANGAVAATVATIVSFPFDTVRTRLIAEQKTCKVYKGLNHAILTMIKTEGVRSLFKGILPTLGQIAPHSGVQFAIYKLLTENFLNKFVIFQRHIELDKRLKTTIGANLIAGSVAGAVAETVIYPFDLVKKRLQIQGFQQHRRNFGRQIYCSGLFHCVKLTLVEEGFLALYKGYIPSVLKAVLVSALHFATYDEIKHFLMRNI